MGTEFDIKKVYAHEWSKEKLIKLLENCYDGKFQVIFLPTDKDKADILIRDVTQNESETEEKNGN